MVRARLGKETVAWLGVMVMLRAIDSMEQRTGTVPGRCRRRYCLLDVGSGVVSSGGIWSREKLA